MDGKDQLRRYLEQRREAGEREFMLDAMTIEDVLRIVGARDEAGRPHSSGLAPVPAAPPEPADAGPADWRTILTAADRQGSGPRAPDASVRPGAPPNAAPPRGPARERPVPTPIAPAADAPPRLVRGPARGEPAPVSDPETVGPLHQWPAGLVAGRAHAELFGGPLSALQSVDDIARAVEGCTRCPLYGTATHAVPGEGSPTASLVCVGEAPGATEDATGRPFVGQAGKLLDKILAAIQLQREDVFICNVLKHRPPGNRNPLPDEVAACSPYLVRQLEVIRPKVIIAFGTFAAQTLLATKDSIGKLRGAVHRYYGVPLIVTYHPAALLRNPAWKRPTWEDVQYARRILDGTGV